MNIGIIIYSQTGNTNTVVNKLKERLSANGHVAEIVQLKVLGEVHPGKKDIQFQSLPGVEQYDVIVFGSPVQAFTLATPMRCYLEQLDSLIGKKVALLVTQFFPYPFLGGNQAIRRMKQICEEKGARICVAEIINWSRRRRDVNITEVVERLSDSLIR